MKRLTISCCFFVLSFAACSPAKPPSKRDLAVLSVVATHFASRTDAVLGDATGIILIWQATTAFQKTTSSGSCFSREDKLRDNFQERADARTIKNFCKRNTVSFPLIGLKATKQYRVATEVDQKISESGQVDYARMGIGLSLPGYSLFGRHALVYVTIPSHHGAWATYVLVKDWDGWKVESTNLVVNGI
jgi:hypothetical protein